MLCPSLSGVSGQKQPSVLWGDQSLILLLPNILNRTGSLLPRRTTLWDSRLACITPPRVPGQDRTRQCRSGVSSPDSQTPQTIRGLEQPIAVWTHLPDEIVARHPLRGLKPTADFLTSF